MESQTRLATKIGDELPPASLNASIANEPKTCRFAISLFDRYSFFMGASRKDVDLELVLKNPNSARKWISGFDWEMPNPPEYIVFGVEEKIYFRDMDDKQAVQAAYIILHDIEIPRAIRELAYERFTH